MRKQFLAAFIIVMVVAFTAPVMAQINDTLNTYRLIKKPAPGLKWTAKYLSQEDIRKLPEDKFRDYVYRQFGSILVEIDTLHQKGDYELVGDQRVINRTTRGVATDKDTTPPPPPPPPAAGLLTVDDMVRLLAAMPQPIVNVVNNNNNLGNQVVGDSSHVSGSVTVGNATAINNAAQAAEKVDSVQTDTLKRASVEPRGAIFRPYMGVSYVAKGSQKMWGQMPLKTDFVSFEIGVMSDYSGVLAPGVRLRADWALTDHKCPFVPTANNQHFLNPAVFGMLAKVGVGGKLSSRLSLHGEFGYQFVRNANSDTHGWSPMVGANIAYHWGKNLLSLNSSVGFAGLGNGTDQPNQMPDGSWRRNPNDGKFRLPVNIRLDFVSSIGLGVFAEGNLQPYGWELNPSREAGQMFPEVQTAQPVRFGLSFVF